MKGIKVFLLMVIALALSACSSEDITNEILNEKAVAKDEMRVQEESNVSKKEDINRIVEEQQSKMQYDDSITLQYKGKKLVITGNSKFTDIDEFNKYYDDIKIQEKIDSFEFESITVNENTGVWHFDDSMINSEGELNRIFKRDILKENIESLDMVYSNGTGFITVMVQKQNEDKLALIPNEFSRLVKKEDKNVAYYIIEGDEDIYNGIIYEEKKEDGYVAFINLEYYNQSSWDSVYALKLKGKLERLFKNLNL